MTKEKTMSQLPQRVLPISVLESSTGFLVKADLPGVQKDDITIDFELGILFLEAKLSPQHKEGEEILLQELSPCHFKRTLKMSSEIDSESITASFELGVLTVSLPKKKSARRRQIPITGVQESLSLEAG